MIFARDKSQMCNNLLQYAHVYAWGREHGRKVISMRFSYKYQYFHICHTSLTGFGWYLLAKYLAAVKILPTVSFKHADCDREALERMMLRHRHIVVSGWNVRFSAVPMYDARREPTEFGITPDVHVTMRDEDFKRGKDTIKWNDGIYCYDDETYARHINRFAEMHKDSEVHVFLSTNDSTVTEEKYQELCPKVHVHAFQGSAPEDLFMLSECDYLIGPPSTFSLVAAMYRDIPLYRMDTADERQMTAERFQLFDFWFRRII